MFHPVLRGLALKCHSTPVFQHPSTLHQQSVAGFRAVGL